MFITKLKVNLFHKPAIYVYLTFKLILNAISPVSRLESEYVYNYDWKFLRTTCTSILQNCIAILLAKEHPVWLQNAHETNILTRCTQDFEFSNNNSDKISSRIGDSEQFSINNC